MNRNRRGFALLEKVFALFVVALMTSAATQSSVIAYRSAHSNRNLLKAGRLAESYLLQRENLSPTAGFEAETKIEELNDQLVQVRVDIRWSEQGRSRTLTRTRLALKETL